MNKFQIKVIKRIDAEAMAKLREQKAIDPLLTTLTNKQAEGKSRRKMDATVASWIFEQRKPTRFEEIASVHKVFGKDIRFGTT